MLYLPHIIIEDIIIFHYVFQFKYFQYSVKSVYIFD